MPEDVFIQKLEWFKQNEKPEVVLLVADHPELTKIIIAWTNTRVGRAEDGPDLCDESENAAWEWLWANAIFSEEELLAKFRNNVGYSALRSDKVEKIIETVFKLDRIDDMTELMSLLNVSGT